LNGSRVELINNAQVIGGTLATSGSAIHSRGAILNNVTNNGALVLDNGSTTTLTGTLTNDGSVFFNNGGGGVDLRLNGSVMLAGSGVVTLNDRSNNRIFANSSGDRLTIGSGVTIQGSGQLGLGQTTFTNNGVLRANQLNALLVRPGGGSADFTNNATGIMEATDGGTLQLPSAISSTTTSSAHSMARWSSSATAPRLPGAAPSAASAAALSAWRTPPR
jgi:hypothetical protein